MSFVEYKKLKADNILVEYCLDYMDTMFIQMGEISGTIWESRILHILKSIESVEQRQSVLLEMMRRTAIPWSDELDLQIKEVIFLRCFITY